MRVTEQGEVVSSKFANRGTALYQLEVLTSSVLVHTLKSREEAGTEPQSRASGGGRRDLARMSFKAYRELAEDPGLIGYFQAASPVEELALSRSASVPRAASAPRASQTFAPFPGSSPGARTAISSPAGIGLGTALDDFLANSGEDGMALLKDMFKRSRGFRPGDR